MPSTSNTPVLLEGLSEPAFIASGQKVLSANAPARALLGERIEGAELNKVISHPAALEALERTGKDESDEIELTGLDSSRRHWLMRTAQLNDGTWLVRILDRSEARAAEQMRVDFVANASHELRTPLATLIGYAETLCEQSAEIDLSTRDRFLSVIHDEARRMQRVVEDLISLSRIEAEKFTAPTDAVEVAPMIDLAFKSARRVAEERGSELTSEVQPGLPPIAADSSQILQLLDNLLTNALRYGDLGTPVRVFAASEGPLVHIEVTDKGEGIPPEHLRRVTERFYRVDTSRSRSLGGTGLGLSIVKHIVERHQGRLMIDSKVGEGTTVHVYLPAVPSSHKTVIGAG